MTMPPVFNAEEPEEPPAKAVLAVSGLCKRYRDFLAVDAVSFSVGRHEILGLVGPNGAGKTTTINMILGVLEPTSGSITIDGFDLGKERQSALARTNFVAVYAPLPGNLTVEQNLRIYGLLYGVRGLSARIEVLLDRFDLGRFRRTKCGTLSSGEQTRAQLAKAFLNEPRLLLLDEPTASLDPAAAHDTRERIRQYAADNEVAVLWTSHNMHEVEDTCDRALFLSHGRILLDGDPKQLPIEHGQKSLEDLFIAVAREPVSGGAH
jgi:ABC-2 type transport system ATP-binding protein